MKRSKLQTLFLRYFPHFLQYVHYFRYLMYHKYTVFAAGCYVGLPYYRSILHDLDKFLPKSFHHYAISFYDENGNQRYQPSDQLSFVWLDHQKRNKHHWQAWVLIREDGSKTPLPIHYPYTLEMVADYLAFSVSVPNALSATEYYLREKDNMILHPKTQVVIESLLMRYDDMDRKLLSNKEGGQCHVT